MKLVNLEGLALVGPGSEWFWSMLQFGIVAVTLYAIYRQIRLQAGAAAIEQASALQHDWHSSERLMRSRLAVLEAHRDGTDVESIAPAAASEIGNYWERVGYLVRAGHIDRRLVFEYLGNAVQLWWALLAPTITILREREGEPMIHEHFEWLASAIAAMDRASGSALVYDDAYLTRHVPGAIAANRDAIRLEERVRAVAR